MDTDWDDLRLFLHVAEQGGLAGTATLTGISAPTIGRRMLALERQILLHYRSVPGCGFPFFCHVRESAYCAPLPLRTTPTVSNRITMSRNSVWFLT